MNVHDGQIRVDSTWQQAVPTDICQKEAGGRKTLATHWQVRPRGCHHALADMYTHAAAATFFTSATKYCQVPVLILGPALFSLPLVRQAHLALSKQGEWLSWFWPRYDYQLFSWPWQLQPHVSLKDSCISSLLLHPPHWEHLPPCWRDWRYSGLYFSISRVPRRLLSHFRDAVGSFVGAQGDGWAAS